MSLISASIQLSWLYYSLVVIYSITVISIIGVVLSENRNPLKSLAWITVLLLFPLGGIILYIFFGRSIKNTRMISRRNRRRLLDLETNTVGKTDFSQYTAETKQQIELGKSLSGAIFYPKNEVKIYHDGKTKFDALLHDILNAKSYILLQYYIIEDDEIGQRVSDSLIERAQNGVRIRVIYDHIGSIHVRNKFFKRMRDAGIIIHPFFRVAFPPFATRINWRNHRKICIIDGKIGYIGGMNIADRYITGGKFNKWRDTHLRITGSAVAALHYSFAVDWTFMGQPLIKESTEIPLKTDNKRTVGMQLLTSGPTSEWSNIAFMMLKAIGNAKKRIYIQTPYFLPTESLLKALQAAALSRIDVRVMIPRLSDSAILTYASYSYIGECLRAGIKIYLYNGGMLHSKTLIIDDEFSSVGSANIDFRSFEHNFESTMFLYSSNVNTELRCQFSTDQKESTRIKAPLWRKRPMQQKAKESIVRLLSPIL